MSYKVRLCGTNEFVSEIEPFDELVEFVEGWDNPSAIVFPTRTSANRAMDKIWEIDGFNTVIERN
tara:strand:+ start:52 stop:246 length:195 start_codon:yes stop_codon:yes gene_type:complete